MAYNDCLAADLCADALKREIAESCDNPIYSGIAPVGVIINYDDIATVVRDAANPHVITALTRKSGKHGYRFVQLRNNPFTGTGTAVEVGDFSNTFTSTVAGFIPLDGAEPSRDIITPMANGRFVVIVRNEWEHVDSNGVVDNRWQVYGIDRGLRVSSLQQTRYENNDAWFLELQETGIRRASTFLIPGDTGCNDVDLNSDTITATVMMGNTLTGSMTIGGVEVPLERVEITPLIGTQYTFSVVSGEKRYNVTINVDEGGNASLIGGTYCDVQDDCVYVSGLLPQA